MRKKEMYRVPPWKNCKYGAAYKKRPKFIKTPSGIIRDYLKANGRSNMWLAKQLNSWPQNITGIVNGSRRLTPALALSISRVTGLNPERLVMQQLRLELYGLGYVKPQMEVQSDEDSLESDSVEGEGVYSGM